MSLFLQSHKPSPTWLKQQSKKAHPFLSFKHLKTTFEALQTFEDYFVSFYHPFSGVNISVSSTICHVAWLPVHPLSFVAITMQCDPRHQMWSVQGRGQWIEVHRAYLLGCYNISLIQVYLVGPQEISSSSQSQLSRPGLFYISCLQIRFPLSPGLAHFWCKGLRAHILGFEGRTDSITPLTDRGA